VEDVHLLPRKLRVQALLGHDGLRCAELQQQRLVGRIDDVEARAREPEQEEEREADDDQIEPAHCEPPSDGSCTLGWVASVDCMTCGIGAPGAPLPLICGIWM